MHHSRRSAKSNLCVLEIHEAAVGDLTTPAKSGHSHPTMTEIGIEMDLQTAWVGPQVVSLLRSLLGRAVRFLLTDFFDVVRPIIHRCLVV